MGLCETEGAFAQTLLRKWRKNESAQEAESHEETNSEMSPNAPDVATGRETHACQNVASSQKQETEVRALGGCIFLFGSTHPPGLQQVLDMRPNALLNKMPWPGRSRTVCYYTLAPLPSFTSELGDFFQLMRRCASAELARCLPTHPSKLHSKASILLPLPQKPIESGRLVC